MSYPSDETILMWWRRYKDHFCIKDIAVEFNKTIDEVNYALRPQLPWKMEIRNEFLKTHNLSSRVPARRHNYERLWRLRFIEKKSVRLIADLIGESIQYVNAACKGGSLSVREDLAKWKIANGVSDE